MWNPFSANSPKWPPTFTALHYSFGLCSSLRDFMVTKAGISPERRILDEVKTHYFRSELFLLGQQSKTSSSLLEDWNAGEKFEAERNTFTNLYAHARKGNSQSAAAHEEDPGGKFEIFYRIFEGGALDLVISSDWMDPRVPHHFPCPDRTIILTTKQMVGIDRHSGEARPVPPGIYQATAKRTAFGPNAAYLGAFLEFLGHGVVDVLLPANEVFASLRAGESLVVAICLYGLPTHVLGQGKPDWASDWPSLSRTQQIDNGTFIRPRASELVQDIQRLWGPHNASKKNLWASWFFHPEHGTFPDEEMYQKHRSQINCSEVFG